MSTQVEFPQLFERCASLDVHKETVVVTVKINQLPDQTRTFSTFTAGLHLLRSWLQEQGVTHLVKAYGHKIDRPLIDPFEVGIKTDQIHQVPTVGASST